MKKYGESLEHYKPVTFNSNIMWNKVMAVWVVTNDVLGQLRKRSAIGSIVYALRESFFDDYCYEIKGEGKIVFFYGRYNWRKDHFKSFITLANSLKNVKMVFANRTKRRIHPIRGLFFIFLHFVWFFQACKCGCGIIEACNVLRPLTLCKKIDRMILELLNENPGIFVTYYDASPDESYAVQIVKGNGIKTATLQHGSFAQKSIKKTISDTAFEYTESVSDYYLAWNKYTKDEWEKIGLDPKKVIVVGIPRYAQPITVEKRIKGDGCKVFGVMLNNGSFDTHNRALIKIANDIAKALKMKYVIRYHPALPDGAYSNLIDKDLFLSISDNSLSIQEYSNTVDFTIISSSSVFIDLVFLGKPVYRLKVTEEDTYSTIQMNAFSNLDEFSKLLNKPGDMNELFDYLCTTRDVASSYQNILNRLLGVS